MSAGRVAAAGLALVLLAGAAAVTWGVRTQGWRVPGLAGASPPAGPIDAPAAGPAFSGHAAPVTSVALSADERRVLSGGGHGDCSVRVWELAPPREATRFTGHGTTCAVLLVSFGGDATRVVSAAGPEDFSLRVWDAATGSERQQLAGDAGVFFRAVSADGTQALAQEMGVDGRSAGFSVWNLATATRTASVQAPDRVAALAFSPDGRTVLSGGENGSLTLWNAATGERLRSFTGHGPQAAVRAVALPAGLRLLASAAADGTIALWDAETGVPFRSIPETAVFALADDGRTLALVGDAPGIRVVDAISGEERARFDGHARVTALGFGPGARRLVSGGQDGTVRVWTVERGTT